MRSSQESIENFLNRPRLISQKSIQYPTNKENSNLTRIPYYNGLYQSTDMQKTSQDPNLTRIPYYNGLNQSTDMKKVSKDPSITSLLVGLDMKMLNNHEMKILSEIKSRVEPGRTY